MSNPVLAVSGSRGGVLATSLTANIAGLMARAGNRVLAVDTQVRPALGLDLGCELVTGSPVRRGVRENLDLIAVADPMLLLKLVAEARNRYDVVLLDGGAAFADVVLVPVRPDRGSTDALRAGPGALGTEVLGVVLVGVPTRPRGIVPRSRKAVAEAAGDRPLCVSTIRSEVAIAWSARERGLLVHELAAQMDRSVLDAHTVDALLGLARDYAELAEEVVVRLHDVAVAS